MENKELQARKEKAQRLTDGALALLKSAQDSELADQMRADAAEMIKRAYAADRGVAGFIMAWFIRNDLADLDWTKPYTKGEKIRLVLEAAANHGNVWAQTALNIICMDEYRREHGSKFEDAPPAPLTDFDGKPIHIRKTGLLTPVDAELTFENGKNVLTLRTNLLFAYGKEMVNAPTFEAAVRRGVEQWSGEYRVFGGQQLTVRVEVSDEMSVGALVDSVYVIPCTDRIQRNLSHSIGTKKNKERMDRILDEKRSFSRVGTRWTPYTRKYIYIVSEDGSFSDFNEIANVAKHEFGHVLGLGDLYASEEDNFKGVDKGVFAELDSFYLDSNRYYLAMSNHHGPVSNNDIEMVVLAFSEGEVQLYQQVKNRDKISKALGRGN